MTDFWACHVDEQLALAGVSDPTQCDIPPLDREQAKCEAWEAADEATAAPTKIAETVNASNQAPRSIQPLSSRP